MTGFARGRFLGIALHGEEHQFLRKISVKGADECVEFFFPVGRFFPVVSKADFGKVQHKIAFAQPLADVLFGKDRAAVVYHAHGFFL